MFVFKQPGKLIAVDKKDNQELPGNVDARLLYMKMSKPQYAQGGLLVLGRMFTQKGIVWLQKDNSELPGKVDNP